MGVLQGPREWLLTLGRTENVVNLDAEHVRKIK